MWAFEISYGRKVFPVVVTVVEHQVWAKWGTEWSLTRRR